MAQAKPQTEWEKRYVYKAQGGKDAVLYAGILDIAHQQGLKDIRTMIVQIPTPDNGNVAICCATVILEKDGNERTFQGIGDASPANVGKQMQTALLRMSETRAKARALRDAVNIGEAAFEEYGNDTQDTVSATSTPMRVEKEENTASASSEEDPMWEKDEKGWTGYHRAALKDWKEYYTTDAEGTKHLTTIIGREAREIGFFVEFRKLSRPELRAVIANLSIEDTAEAPHVSPPALTIVQGETEHFSSEMKTEAVTCSKVAYSTPYLARQAMVRLTEKPDYVKPEGKTLGYYACIECTQRGVLGSDTVYHIGHTAFPQEEPKPLGIPDPNAPLLKAQRESIVTLSEIHNRTVPENLDKMTWNEARVLLVELNSIRQVNPPPRTSKKKSAEDPPAVKVGADDGAQCDYLRNAWVKQFGSSALEEFRKFSGREWNSLETAFDRMLLSEDAKANAENAVLIKSHMTQKAATV